MPVPTCQPQAIKFDTECGILGSEAVQITSKIEFLEIYEKKILKTPKKNRQILKKKVPQSDSFYTHPPSTISFLSSYHTAFLCELYFQLSLIRKIRIFYLAPQA